MARPVITHALDIPLRFSYQMNGVANLGSGRVSDLGRGGVRFQTGSPPPGGAEVELWLAWPFHPRMVYPPELLIRGTVLRTGSRGTVVRMRHYEFRHCGERPFDQAAANAQARGSMA
jgi:hypothetical protein